VSPSYWRHVALTWHLTESVKNFNRIWRQGSICNYCISRGPPVNFLNHREWKIIMVYHRDQRCNYPLFDGTCHFLMYSLFEAKVPCTAVPTSLPCRKLVCHLDSIQMPDWTNTSKTKSNRHFFLWLNYFHWTYFLVLGLYWTFLLICFFWAFLFLFLVYIYISPKRRRFIYMSRRLSISKIFKKFENLFIY